MERTKREIIFFILIFLIFYLVVKFSHIFKRFKLSPEMIIILSGIIFTAIIFFIYNLSRLKSQENFWDVSLASQCGPDSFFWKNGNSELSKKCRELAETPEGRVALFGQRCPYGQVGKQGLSFYYDVISDDSWQNSRCKNKVNCPLIDNGECLTDRQLP